MEMCTTSETISFAKALEEKAGEFYETLSTRFEQARDLAAFKEENRKFGIQIQRAYQSVITDAIEGCFAFKLESDNYAIDTDLPEGIGLEEAAQKALAVEETIIDFYTTAEGSPDLIVSVYAHPVPPEILEGISALHGMI